MEIPTSPTNYSPPPGPPDCDPPTPWEAECEISAVLNAIRTVSEDNETLNAMELHHKDSNKNYTSQLYFSYAVQSGHTKTAVHSRNL